MGGYRNDNQVDKKDFAKVKINSYKNPDGTDITSANITSNGVTASADRNTFNYYNKKLREAHSKYRLKTLSGGNRNLHNPVSQ